MDMGRNEFSFGLSFLLQTVFDLGGMEERSDAVNFPECVAH